METTVITPEMPSYSLLHTNLCQPRKKPAVGRTTTWEAWLQATACCCDRRETLIPALLPAEGRERDSPIPTAVRLSGHPAAGRQSWRASKAGLSFRKPFFSVLAPAPAQTRGLGFLAASSCSQTARSCLPAPKTPHQRAHSALWPHLLLLSLCAHRGGCPQEDGHTRFLYHRLDKGLSQGKLRLDARESCLPASGVQPGTTGLAVLQVLEIPQTQTDKAQNNQT